jgi:hypothetical protein
MASKSPEPIEDGIARAIEAALEPYVVSLLAVVIAGRASEPDGLDHACDAEKMENAVTHALRLLSVSRERIEFNYETRVSIEREMKEQSEGEWLLCESRAEDDSFRQYLRKAGAPGFILKRGFVAHRNALLRHNIPFNNDKIDGQAVFSLRPALADTYIRAERDVRAQDANRRRQQAKKGKSAS